MSDFFDRFLAFHAPRPQNKRDYKFIEEQVRQHDEEVIKTLAKIIGSDSIERRLEDLAKHNSVTPGRIPVIYAPDDIQSNSHNILPGIPYTGNYITHSRGLDTIAPHELTHTILGKFNDGITEPIASLFIKGRPHLPETSFSDALEARGALELFARFETVCSFRSIVDLFRNRAKFRNIVAHYHRGNAVDLSKADIEKSDDTHEFVRLLVRDRYASDVVNHPTIDLPSTSPGEHRRVLEALQASYREVEPYFLLNPNENSGDARGFALRIGRALMQMLLLAGLDDKQPDQASPEEARESIRQLLLFYFEPFRIESLRQYGFESWCDLQSALLEHVVSMTDEFVQADESGWNEFKNQLVQDPRYDPATWSQRQMPGPPPEPIDRLLRGSEPPTPIFHPVVELARQCSDDKSIIDLMKYLGKDKDYNRYCSLGEERD